jgi:hypothetical protein
MMCGIQHLSRDVFYSDKVILNAVFDPEDKALRLAAWNMDEHKVNSNALLVDVPWTTEECIGTSFANAGNRKVVLDLTRKLVCSGLSAPKDIVILVGYEAQWRLYIKDLHKLAQVEPCVAWSSVRAFKVDAMQGNEADIVIFDYVRSGKQHGFMGAFRRLNVACSRGRIGFYLVASARTLKTVQRFGFRTPSELHKSLESRNAKVTLETPADFTADDADDVDILRFGTTERAPSRLPFYTPRPPALSSQARAKRALVEMQMED